MKRNQLSYRLVTFIGAISGLTFIQTVALVRRIHGGTFEQKLNVQNATVKKKAKKQLQAFFSADSRVLASTEAV